jgi:hypothetical protein
MQSNLTTFLDRPYIINFFDNLHPFRHLSTKVCLPLIFDNTIMSFGERTKIFLITYLMKLDLIHDRFYPHGQVIKLKRKMSNDKPTIFIQN